MRVQKTVVVDKPLNVVFGYLSDFTTTTEWDRSGRTHARGRDVPVPAHAGGSSGRDFRSLMPQMRPGGGAEDANAPVLRACSRVCVKVSGCRLSGSERLRTFLGSALTPCAAGRMGDGSKRSPMPPGDRL